MHEVGGGGERRSEEANLAGAAAVVGLRAWGRAGVWADGAEGGDRGEDCGRFRPWRKRLHASMALSWPSAIHLAVAAVLLIGVGVAVFTLPVDKVRPVLPSHREFVPWGIRCHVEGFVLTTTGMNATCQWLSSALMKCSLICPRDVYT
jgi:hypothetical protein